MPENHPLRTSSELLRHFFMPIQGAHEAPDHYFRGTFVAPSQLDDLVRRMTPTSPPRLLLWDGQSRIGKTWSAIGALATLLDRGLVDTVWTTGEDSHIVFDRTNTANPKPLTLLSGFRAVERKLIKFLANGALRGRVVILLDDFVGTARLRSLANSERDLEELAGYFVSDLSRNSLLQRLSELPAALVVITGRSSVFTSARVRLRLPITPSEDRVSRGVFQTIDGTLVGAIDDAWLREVITTHTAYINEHTDFLLPPVTAFANQPPPDVLNEPQLPRMLFGADLAEFADEVQASEAAETVGFDKDIAEKLDDIYLLYVAPALMYPERAADDWLWSTGSAQALRDALYLHPGVEGLHLRVPNRFYLRAVTAHLSHPSRLALLARVLLRKLPRIDEQRHRGVLVRGFAERLLARGEPLPKPLLDDTVHLFELAGEDPLLWWQQNALLAPRKTGDSVPAATVLTRPGLASALGWSMITFPRVQSRPVFKSFLEAITHEVRLAVHNESDDRLDDDLRRTIAVSYSNLLRWFTYDLDRKGHPRTIAELSKGLTLDPSHQLPPRLSDLIDMVFEDVMIWADELGIAQSHVHIKGVPTGKRLLAELHSDLREPSRVTETEFAVWRLVNRLFSLSWHNDWMWKSKSYYKDVAVQWVDHFLPVGIDALKKQPELLAINLQYHWHHMLAQWAVWTRDWCFAGEHDSDHGGHPLEPSLDEDHTRAIRGLLGVVLAIGTDPIDIRNAFFLLGTRARYGEGSTVLLSALSDAATRGGDHARGYLQAIFELARQGFLDQPYPNTMGEQLSVHPSTNAREFRNACRRFLSESRPETTWKAYRSDLDNVTHLDVLPDSWHDVLPADWISAKDGSPAVSGITVSVETRPDRPD